MLEVALFSPILLYLLIAVFDFARYYTEASQLGEVAIQAARSGGDSSFAPAVSTEIETFCACPFEPEVRFACGQRACGDYGEPARYTRATVTQPFAFMGRYPGFPRQVSIRRQAGFRTH